MQGNAPTLKALSGKDVKQRLRNKTESTDSFLALVFIFLGAMGIAVITYLSSNTITTSETKPNKEMGLRQDIGGVHKQAPTTLSAGDPVQTIDAKGQHAAESKRKDVQTANYSAGENLAYYPYMDVDMINKLCNIDLRGEDLSQCKNKRLSTTNPAQPPQYAIKRNLHILGERHSGTNVATELILQNFKIQLPTAFEIKKNFPGVNIAQFQVCSKYHCFVGSRYAIIKDNLLDLQREFGLNNHKHNTQEDKGYYPGLTIISMRNPYDWVAAMMEECYHCAKENLDAVNDPHRFVQLPFKKGAHVLPGELYHNIFDMRQRKFCNHIAVSAARSDCVIVIRAEDNVLRHQQENFVAMVERMTGWSLMHGSPRHVTGYFGRMKRTGFDVAAYIAKSLFLKTEHTNEDQKVISAVNKHMNAEFEQSLGFQRIGLEDPSL